MLYTVLKLESIQKTPKWEKMKKLISYPLLLTTAIIFDRVLASITQIDVVQSIQPLFIGLGSTFVAALLVQQFVKDWGVSKRMG